MKINKKSYVVEYVLLLFWILTLLSNVNRFVLHINSKSAVPVLIADVFILLFGVGVFFNLLGKLNILAYVFLISGIIGHVIFYKHITFYIIVIDCILCLILIGEKIIQRFKNNMQIKNNKSDNLEVYDNKNLHQK